MFFEKEMISFHILDVFELKQQNHRVVNRGRNYSALSYRFRADTVLETDSDTFHVGDHTVGYFPARLDYTRTAKIDRMIVVHFDTVSYSTKTIECFVPKHPERIAPLFEEMLALWNKQETGYKYRAAALLYQILAECYIQNDKPQAPRSKIQSSVDFMREHYKNPDLTVKEIARQSFMSEVYFRKLFRAEYGMSPQKYLIRLRLQNAVGLISTGYYSLKEVAYLSGYSDYKYFSVEFKKAMGVSPSQYLYKPQALQ